MPRFHRFESTPFLACLNSINPHLIPAQELPRHTRTMRPGQTRKLSSTVLEMDSRICRRVSGFTATEVCKRLLLIVAARRHIFSKSAICITTVVVLSGCHSLNRYESDFMSPINPMAYSQKTLLGPDVFAKFHTDMMNVAWLESKYYGIQLPQGQAKGSESNSREAPSAVTPDQRTTYRNQIAQILLDDFNLCWYVFSSSFQGRYGLFKSSTDATAGTMTAFAAATPTQETAKLLSAGAASILGLSSAVQKDFFQGNAAYILLGQMDADRQQIQAAIRANLAKPDVQYPLNQLLIDMWNYVDVMTVPHALAALNGKVGQQVISSQDNTYRLQQPKVSIANSPSSQTLDLADSAKKTVHFAATGGAGNGSFEWTCEAADNKVPPQKFSGPSAQFEILATEPSYTVSVFRAGDKTYAQSNTESAVIRVRSQTGAKTNPKT